MSQIEETSQSNFDKLTLALDSGTFVDVRHMLNALPPADVAHMLQFSLPKVRHVLWKMIDEDNKGEVLNELSDELRIDFLSEMEVAKVAELMEGLEDAHERMNSGLLPVCQAAPACISRIVASINGHVFPGKGVIASSAPWRSCQTVLRCRPSLITL